MSEGAPADRVLVLVDRRGDRELVVDRLDARCRVDAPDAATVDDVPAEMDLVVVDAANARRLGDVLRERKTAESVFAPVLLFLDESTAPPTDVWEYATDVVRTPIRRREFDARVDTLLHSRRASLALRERERALASQAAELERFASLVAHDLRNPLTAAEGWLAVAAEEGEAAAFREVEDAHDRMRALIDDVLSLARQGELLGGREPVHLGELAESAWGDFDAGDATLSVTSGADDLVFFADRDRLLELLGNLFRNAVQHAGPAVAVTVGTLDGGRGFYVEDDGPGVPEDLRDELFEAGVTGDPESGTGYGLSIVAAVADAHGWTVTAAPADPDRGARFEVRGLEIEGE